MTEPREVGEILLALYQLSAMSAYLMLHLDLNLVLVWCYLVWFGSLYEYQVSWSEQLVIHNIKQRVYHIEKHEENLT